MTKFLSILRHGIIMDEERLRYFDFRTLIEDIMGSPIKYSDLHNLKITYQDTEWDQNIFEYLVDKQNSDLLYKKVEKVENIHDDEIIKRIKKLKWRKGGSALSLRDLNYHFKHFTLTRMRYDGKKCILSDNQKKYEKYKDEIKYFSDQLSIHIDINELFEIMANPGSKYHLAYGISLIIKDKSNKISVLRFKFLNERTSYADQGTLVSIVYSLFCIFFRGEHGMLPQREIKKDLFLETKEKEILRHIYKKIATIDQVILFREPGIGRVFEKYEYRFSPNHYYMDMLHTREGIDISRGGLVENSILVRDQEIATKHQRNDHDIYKNRVCYFNFIEMMLLGKQIRSLNISKDIFHLLMDTVNEGFFDIVINQQICMVQMIDNSVESKFTKNIKGCSKSNIEMANNELKNLKKLNSKKGPDRIKNDEYQWKTDCIKKWIEILKEVGSIHPGSKIFLTLDSKMDNTCAEYIEDLFSMMIPWRDWKICTDHVKTEFKQKLKNKNLKIDKENREDIDIFLTALFGNKSFLYKQRAGGRAVFYQDIEKQFDAYGEWKLSQLRKNKAYKIKTLLKSSISEKALETFSSFLK